MNTRNTHFISFTST